MNGIGRFARGVGLDPGWVREEVDGFLGEFLGGVGYEAGLVEAMRYALLGPGKRTRPRLVLESFVAAGGEVGGVGWDGALRSAGAVEMVHAFSLVHDDLPALDDDDVRRGRATVHREFGEAMAVLVGDGLLALAFRAIGEGAGEVAVGGGLAGRLVCELARGTGRMVNGQVLDTLGGLSGGGGLGSGVAGGGLGGGGGVEGLRAIHRDKTGALIAASCRMGGVCAGSGEEAVEALGFYGEDVGLMFQVVDDLLDVEGDAAEVGKATGKDAEAGKVTYPGLLGVAESRAEVVRLRDRALGRLSAFGSSGAGLVRLCDELSCRTA